jgi:hypothetical protein
LTRPSAASGGVLAELKARGHVVRQEDPVGALLHRAAFLTAKQTSLERLGDDARKQRVRAAVEGY